MPELALISLGSNLGDRKALLDSAVASLSETPAVSLRAVSSYHETAPVGGPSGQGAFLNAAAALETTLDPEILLDRLHSIEQQANRVRTVRWGERTLDLDLLLYGDRVIESPRLSVPHPRMALRRFVLAPLSEVAPDAIHPSLRRTIRELLVNLDRRPSYVAIACPIRLDVNPYLFWTHRFEPKKLVELSRSFLGESVGLFHRLQEVLPGIAVEERILSSELERVADLLSIKEPESVQDMTPVVRNWPRLLPMVWLSSNPIETTTSDATWLVSHFWFDVEFLTLDSLKAARPRFTRFYEEFLEARSNLLPPTFVVARPVDLERMGLRDHRCDWQWPIGRDTPILEVKDFDSDETIEEVLATCVATRSV